MKKYWLIFFLTIKEYFSYRVNFLIWRFRVFLSFLIIFFLWSSVFQSVKSFGQYSFPEFISYIFFANLIGNFVLATRTVDVAGEITNGNIINLLIRPVSFFKYYLARDLADKLLNLFFVVIEIALLIFLLHPPLILPQGLSNFLIGGYFLVIGMAISFLLSLLISFVGFWSHEVWGPRFIFMILVFLFSGNYFPLDVLPNHIFKIFLITPFPYLFYLPTQIFYGRFFLINFQTLFFSLFWFLILIFSVKYVWQKGNQSYNFFGR